MKQTRKKDYGTILIFFIKLSLQTPTHFNPCLKLWHISGMKESVDGNILLPRDRKREWNHGRKSLNLSGMNSFNS